MGRCRGGLAGGFAGREGLGGGCRVDRLAHAEPVDEERDRVDAGVEEEPLAAEHVVDQPGRDQAGTETGERGALEPGRRPTAEELVAGRGHRDEAEDRRDRGGRRGALEEARATDQRQVRGQPREHHGDATEERSELHHAVMAESVRQDPERRGEDQFEVKNSAANTDRAKASTSRPPCRGSSAR